MSRIPKKMILDACIKRQEELVHDFEKRVQETRTDAYDHSDSASQDDETAATKLDVLAMLEEELGFNKYELAILEEINPDEEITQVQKGAVVVTDQRLFFIGVSTEEIEVNGTNVFGMSEKAPLFQEMRMKSKGDNVSYNGITYHIQDIY